MNFGNLSFESIMRNLENPMQREVLLSMLICVACYVKFAPEDSEAVSWTVHVEGPETGWFKVTVQETDPTDLDDQAGSPLVDGPAYIWN